MDKDFFRSLLAYKNFTEGVPWNVTILGYTLRNGRFVVVPEEAAVVRQIYDLYLDGKGYAAIADILNASDAKTRYGRTSHRRRVCSLTRSGVTWVLAWESDSRMR